MNRKLTIILFYYFEKIKFQNNLRLFLAMSVRHFFKILNKIIPLEALGSCGKIIVNNPLLFIFICFGINYSDY